MIGGGWLKLLCFILSIFIASSIVFSGCVSSENADKSRAVAAQETPAPENKMLPDKWAFFTIDNDSFSSDYEWFANTWIPFFMNTYGFPAEHIVLISDYENFTKQNAVNTLKWMINNTGENSTVVFSFNGHGAAGAGSEGRTLGSYIVFKDGNLWDYEMGEMMKDWKCKRFLFVSEGCQNGFFCHDESDPLMGGNPGIATAGRAILSGSSEATLAWSNDTGPLFHQFVYAGLFGNAADGWNEISNDATGGLGEKDGNASVEEAFWYARNHVSTNGIVPGGDFVCNMEAQPKMYDGVEGEFFL